MNISRVKQIMTDKIFKAMDGIAIKMEAVAITKAPKVIGSLQQHIRSKTELQGSTITAQLICTSPYGKYIEEGTGPAAGHARFFPPPGVLINWLMRGVGMSEDQAREKEFVFRRAIHIHGTKAQPFMEPAKQEALKTLRPKLKDAISTAVREIRSELG